jgi:hypothetical protein
MPNARRGAGSPAWPLGYGVFFAELPPDGPSIGRLRSGKLVSTRLGKYAIALTASGIAGEILQNDFCHRYMI